MRLNIVYQRLKCNTNVIIKDKRGLSNQRFMAKNITPQPFDFTGLEGFFLCVY